MNYQDIIKLVNNKDQKGLEALYQQYAARFYSYAVTKWQLDEDGAWDVIYKTLETLILKLSNYKFESQFFFDAFLYKVFVNFIRQRFREQRGKLKSSIEFVDIDDEFKVSKQINQSAFAEYYQSECIDNPQLQLLNDALEKLEPKDRDLLLLKAQNYTYEEIGELLQIESANLKVKHHRAKTKLINILSETKTINHEHSK